MSKLLASVLAAALLLAACSSDSEGGQTTTSGGDGMTLSIVTPEDGAEVSAPFTVEFDSSEELGPTETGAHHVHIFWDGDDSEYTVIEADSFEVTDLPPAGEHTLNASLRNADHSPAGVEEEITVTVGAGGTESDTSDDGDEGADTGDDGAFDY